MRQGAFFDISFATQLIKLPNLVNMSKGNHFHESCKEFGRLGLASGFFSI